MSIASEQWMAEGIQIGRVLGKAEGKTEGKAEILLRQLRRRFGAVPETTLHHVLMASDDDLNMWADGILDAASLEAVFAPRRNN